MSKVQEQKERVEREIKKLESMGGSIKGKFDHLRDSGFERFPVIFVLLSSFGLVATFYGFEKVIDTIPFFTENPHMILVTGILILIFTGTLYKKLN